MGSKQLSAIKVQAKDFAAIFNFSVKSHHTAINILAVSNATHEKRQNRSNL
jgi:hypothetical protein